MPSANIAAANSPVLLSPSPTPTSISYSNKHVRSSSSFSNNIEVKKPASFSASTTSTILKRKRPPRITIPIVPSSFESVAQMTNRDRLENEVEVEGEGYSLYCRRGKRGALEDRYSAIIPNPQNHSKQAFFGVFDGHGGVKAADFAAKNIGKNIISEVALRSEEGLKEAVREGYLTTDANFLKLNANGGSSCVTN